jgi:hypothetical protein
MYMIWILNTDRSYWYNDVWFDSFDSFDLCRSRYSFVIDSFDPLTYLIQSESLSLICYEFIRHYLKIVQSY